MRFRQASSSGHFRRLRSERLLKTDIFAVISAQIPYFVQGSGSKKPAQNDRFVQVSKQEEPLTSVLQIVIFLDIFIANKSYEDGKTPTVCARITASKAKRKEGMALLFFGFYSVNQVKQW
ncbi:MAG: hypothetical protein J6W19_11830 [Prevotella sp.]|nr:hypothetical protein [Prevotella sp.]